MLSQHVIIKINFSVNFLLANVTLKILFETQMITQMNEQMRIRQACLATFAAPKAKENINTATVQVHTEYSLHSLPTLT